MAPAAGSLSPARRNTMPQRVFVSIHAMRNARPIPTRKSTLIFRDALKINVLFLVGMGLAFLMAWMLTNTRWGMVLRLAGESEPAAGAMGYAVDRIRMVATAIGGFLAGIA